MVALSRPMSIARWVLLAVTVLAAGTVAVAVFERVVPPNVRRIYQRYLGNPTFRVSAGFVPGFGILETIGHRTGQLRRVPVGGRRIDGAFWLVTGNPRHVYYVRNIEANPNVRVRFHGRWHKGTATFCPDDDARRRAVRVNPYNGWFLRMGNTELLSIRVALAKS